MKKLLLLNALLLGLFMFTGSAVKAQAYASATAGGYCGCAVCNCWHYYGNCAWCVTDAAYTGAVNEMPVRLSVVNPGQGQGQVLIEYQIPLVVTHEENFTLSSDVSVPGSLCDKMGVHTITLLAGTYFVDYSKNPNGTITCKAIIQ